MGIPDPPPYHLVKKGARCLNPPSPLVFNWLPRQRCALRVCVGGILRAARLEGRERPRARVGWLEAKNPTERQEER